MGDVEFVRDHQDGDALLVQPLKDARDLDQFAVGLRWLVGEDDLSRFTAARRYARAGRRKRLGKWS
jgi:hypothetical protein